MNAFDKRKKPKHMPGQDYTITVKIFASESNFPSTGETGKFYFGGTVSDYENDQGTVKYWNGTQYASYAGPRPKKPPPNP
jgi:hypothetical protein